MYAGHRCWCGKTCEYINDFKCTGVITGINMEVLDARETGMLLTMAFATLKGYFCTLINKITSNKPPFCTCFHVLDSQLLFCNKHVSNSVQFKVFKLCRWNLFSSKNADVSTACGGILLTPCSSAQVPFIPTTDLKTGALCECTSLSWRGQGSCCLYYCGI